MPQKDAQTDNRQPMIYHDFNLRFSTYNPEDGTFKVWVEGETPGGTMRPDDAVECTYDPTAFWKNPDSGIGGLMGKLDRRRITRDELFALGKRLADLALPEGHVRTLFQQSLVALGTNDGLRLRLRVDPVELTQLPWEYIALPQASGEQKDTDFFSLRREFSIVRTDTVEAPSRTLPDRANVQVVGVLSNPDDSDDLKVDQDKDVIEKVVQTLNEAAGQELINLTWADRPATRQAVEQALANGTDIFHYAGHAIFEKLSQEGKLILENEDDASDLYSAEQLGQLLRGAGVRLAILGACETGRRDGQNVWSGIAPALSREKLHAVVANQFKIKDKHAILLAAKIYHLVLTGHTIDEALFEARQTIYQQSGLEDRDWGVPVLYLQDQDGILFPISEVQGEKDTDHPFVRVANRIKTIKGKYVDLKIETLARGHVESNTEIDVVEEGGEAVGVSIGKLG